MFEKTLNRLSAAAVITAVGLGWSTGLCALDQFELVEPGKRACEQALFASMAFEAQKLNALFTNLANHAVTFLSDGGSASQVRDDLQQWIRLKERMPSEISSVYAACASYYQQAAFMKEGSVDYYRRASDFQSPYAARMRLIARQQERLAWHNLAFGNQCASEASTRLENYVRQHPCGQPAVPAEGP